jgi:uncharacterized protein
VDPAEIALVAAAVLLSAVIQSTSGFGFALLAVPLMSIVVSTEQAVVVVAVVSLVASAGQAIGHRAHGDRPVIGRMLAGAVVGAPIGLAVFSVLTGRQLRFALAAIIFTFLALTIRGFSLRKAGRTVDLGAGVVAGVLNTSLSTNGPPIVMALHARGLPPEPFRATVAAVFAGSSVIAVGLFAATGRYDRDALVLIAASLPALGVGYAIGVRQRRRFDLAGFRRLVLGLLTVTGVVTLAGALLA